MDINEFVKAYQFGRRYTYTWNEWNRLHSIFKHMKKETQNAVIRACGHRAEAGIVAHITFPLDVAEYRMDSYGNEITEYYVATYYENGMADTYHYGWVGHITE